jgi:hypothetical protein
LLGRLADYGCRVLLFLDGVHKLPENGFKSNIKPWVRQLQLERRVITFVASKDGPSSVDTVHEQGLFAEGILGALEGTRVSPAAITLEQFRRAMHRRVEELSDRAQDAEVFIPIEVDPLTSFARPRD